MRSIQRRCPNLILVLLTLSVPFWAQAPDPQQNHLPVNKQPANPKLPTLYIVGDSTVRNGRGDGANGQWGWGDLIGKYFDPAKINVVNWALGGRSSRTFITQGHWDRVVSALKPGDFVMIQFGNDDSRARGSLRGTEEETQRHRQLAKQRACHHPHLRMVPAQ